MKMKRNGTHLPSIERMTELLQGAAHGGALRVVAADVGATNEEYELVKAIEALIDSRIYENQRDRSDD